MRYEVCECRFWLGRWWTREAGYSRELAVSRDWELVSGDLPIVGDLIAGGTLCQLDSRHVEGIKRILSHATKFVATSAINCQTVGVSGYRYLILLCVAFVVGAVGVGCRFKQARYEREIETRQKETVRQFNELMKGYFEGDLEQARKCLQQAASLLEGDAHSEPVGRAQLLHLTYFHLYVLEKRACNELAAEAALIKAQYWCLKKAELLGVNVEKAMKQLREFTPERIFEYIDDFDRRHNNGQEPAYIRFTQKVGDVVPGQGETTSVDLRRTAADMAIDAARETTETVGEACKRLGMLIVDGDGVTNQDGGRYHNKPPVCEAP